MLKFAESLRIIGRVPINPRSAVHGARFVGGATGWKLGPRTGGRNAPESPNVENGSLELSGVSQSKGGTGGPATGAMCGLNESRSGVVGSLSDAGYGCNSSKRSVVGPAAEVG